MSTELEGTLAGLLSTFPHHSSEHPAECLPEARAVLKLIRESDREHGYRTVRLEQAPRWDDRMGDPRVHVVVLNEIENLEGT